MKTKRYIQPATTKIIVVENDSLLVPSVQTPDGNIIVDENNPEDPGGALGKQFSIWDEEE